MGPLGLCVDTVDGLWLSHSLFQLSVWVLVSVPAESSGDKIVAELTHSPLTGPRLHASASSDTTDPMVTGASPPPSTELSSP